MRDDSSNPGPGSAPKHAATIFDVAKYAGVSISAVSRTYTAGASVSAATRNKVENAARNLDYRPNLIARSLSRKRSEVIAIAIARLENSFHAALLQALTRRLRAIGFGTMLFVADENGDADPLVEEMLRHRIDAIILCAVSVSPAPERDCRRVGVPLVFVNRETLTADTVAVVGDNENGAFLIASLLVAVGHKHLAYIAGTRDSSTSLIRQRIFASTLAEHGIAPPQIVQGDFDRATAQAAARRLLAQPQPPDAVFCANDEMALGVMDVATREFRRTLGADLSIVGYDDIREARLGIGLTTYSQPVEQMADHAVDAVRALIKNEQATTRLALPGRLVLRGSSRMPRQGVSHVGGELVWTPP